MRFSVYILDPLSMRKESAPLCLFPASSGSRRPLIRCPNPTTQLGGKAKNEYTFSEAMPGRFTLNLKMRVYPSETAQVPAYHWDGLVQFYVPDQPAFVDRCNFTLPSLEGSSVTWKAANPDGKSDADGDCLIAEGSYIGLPSSNSTFGPKNAGFLCDSQSNLVDVAEGKTAESAGKFEVFFPKYAKNHPGVGTGITPNWFYYWTEEFGITHALYGGFLWGNNGMTPGWTQWT